MLLLLGALGAGAYYLAAPIKTLAQRFFPEDSKPAATVVERDTDGKAKAPKTPSGQGTDAGSPPPNNAPEKAVTGPQLIAVEPTPPIIVPAVQGSGAPTPGSVPAAAPDSSVPSQASAGAGQTSAAAPSGGDTAAGGSPVTVREAQPASIVRPIIVDEVNTEGLPIPKTRKAVVVPDDPAETARNAPPALPAGVSPPPQTGNPPPEPSTLSVPAGSAKTPAVPPASAQSAVGPSSSKGAEPPVVEVKGSSGGGLRTSDALQATAVEGPTVKAEPVAAPAADALKRFFEAKDYMQRSHYVLGASVVLPLMERYYGKVPDGPITVDEITLLRHDPKPEIGTGAHAVFSVASKQWAYPIPVMLQEEADGYKVDWLAFVEFKDDLLFKFLSAYQEAPARFHVAIRRTHYFDNDVPDRQAKECFEILPPLPTYAGYVFVDSGTPLANDLTKKIGWETRTAFVIVELQWRRQGEFRWVELKDVPQLNWYSLPLDASGKPLKPSTATSGGAVKPPPPTSDSPLPKKPTSSAGENTQGSVTVTR